MKTEPPDEILVVAAILGDLEAFGELVTRYRAAVVRTAQGIVGRADAEDVAQDALLLAFKALPSIEDPTRFASWLLVITRHRAYRFGKQQQKRRAGRVELDEVLLSCIGALSQPLVSVREEHEALRLALDGLPERYALPLRLCYLDYMPYKRIAAFLDLPLSTVKWRLHRGKELMRANLEKLSQQETLWTENKS